MTTAKRRLVKILASCGTKQERIAEAVGLESPITLRKYFRKDLDHGEIRANAQVAAALLKMATSGKNPAATIFFLKCQGDWCEDAKLGAAPEEDRHVQLVFVAARDGRSYYPDLDNPAGTDGDLPGEAPEDL
jgi:hypothetical protein